MNLTSNLYIVKIDLFIKIYFYIITWVKPDAEIMRVFVNCVENKKFK